MPLKAISPRFVFAKKNSITIEKVVYNVKCLRIRNLRSLGIIDYHKFKWRNIIYFEIFSDEANLWEKGNFLEDWLVIADFFGRTLGA